MIKYDDDEIMAVDYQRLFEAHLSPYLAFAPNDPIFTIVAENKAHAKVALSNPTETIGKPVFDVYPDTSEKYITTGVSDFKESLRKVIRTGKPDVMPQLNYNVPGPHGKYVEKWWRLTHYPVFDKSGKLMLICQATEDITEQVKAENKFNLAKSQLDTALEIGSVSTWIWDIENDIVTGDKNLAKNFGFKPQDVANGLPIKSFTDTIIPDERERVVTAIAKSIENNTIFDQEYQTVPQAGTTQWVISRGKIQKDENGKPVYLLGVIVDITDRKKVQQELELVKSMFDALFESNILSIALADIHGNVLEANKTFLNTFGYTEADLKTGISSVQLTPTASKPITNKLYDDLRAKGETEPLEKEYIRKDGSTIPMLIGAAMLPNSEELFMAYMLDITENRELRALNEAKDEFIGMASHQLRTPATVVKQYLSLLTSGFAGPLSDKQQGFAERAYASNERQLTIVNDLLKTAQIDSKRYILKKDYVGVAAIVEESMADMHETLKQRQQEIVHKDGVDGAAIYVDRTELHLVLVNLIENASKYSPAGSVITVTTKLLAHRIQIAVTDNGVGIAPEDVKRIFQKFTRVNNELSDTVAGSGLGLYWVDRIINMHGGTIKVKSTVGKGSSFIVNLPYEHK